MHELPELVCASRFFERRDALEECAVAVGDGRPKEVGLVLEVVIGRALSEPSRANNRL